MKRIIQIMLLLLLISGTMLGQEKNNCPMDILVFGKSPKQYMIFSITSPEEKEVWNADSNTNKVLNSKKTSIEIYANNWYSIPGQYCINVESWDKQGNNIIISKYDLVLNGKEINIRTTIDLTPSDENSELSIAFFYIEKRYYSTDSVILIERWKPTPNGEPTYILINNSTRNIKGTAFENNFFGDFMKFEDGKWNKYFRGITCGLVSEGESVSPGDSTYIGERYIRGKPNLFTPGRYKYYVCYTHSSYDFPLFRRRAKNNDVDIYLLEKEFTIE